MTMIPTIVKQGRRYLLSLLNVGFVSAASLCCTACFGPVDEVNLTLLYVTDVHGRLLSESFGLSEAQQTSMANFSTYANYVYNTRGKDNTVLLCGGDLNDGLPLEYYYNNVARFDSHISPLVMNYLNFDAVQLGASDMFQGMDVWIGILPAQYKMPYMCANLLDNKTQIPPFPPYTIVERGGLRIAVIGLLDPEVCSLLGPEDIQGLHLGDMVQVLQDWMMFLKEIEKPDYTIVMASTKMGNEALFKVEGVDLFLVGGIDHEALPIDEYRINGAGDTVRIVQPMPYMHECARVDLRFSKSGRSAKVQKTDVLRVPLSQLPADTAFARQFEPQVEKVNYYLDTKIGNFTRPMKYADALFGPSVWLDVKHDMQLWSTGADISICNIGSEPGDLQPGSFRMRDLFHFFDNDSKLWVVPMTGEEIKTFMESAVAYQFNQMTTSADHLLAFKYNDMNEVAMGTFGPMLVQDPDLYCSAAGIRYTVDVSKPKGERVTIMSMGNGTPFHVTETYRVAMPDNLAMGDGGYISALGWDKETALRRLDFHGKLRLRTHFINFVKAHKNYAPASRNEWSVIPSAYFEAGRKRDYQLLKRYVQ